MVLGGGSTTRPFVAAAQIVQAGLAKKILVPRFGHSQVVREGVADAEDEANRQVALRLGVSSDSIVQLDSVVDSTETEAKSLAEFLDSHPEALVAVVTNDFHTRRTRLLFSRACGDRAKQLRFVGAPTDDFDATNWWKFENGVVLYLNEFLKLARAFVF